MNSKVLQIIGTIETDEWRLPDDIGEKHVWKHEQYVNYQQLPWLSVEPSDEWKFRYKGAAASMRKAAVNQVEEATRLRFLNYAAPYPFQFLASPFFAIWDAGKDLVRRPKTALGTHGFIILGLILGVGFILALPFIGALIGGPIGAAIGASTISFGGILGGAVMGAVLGGFVAKLFSKKFFMKERKYNPKSQDIKNYKKAFGINEDIHKKINAYLRNKENSINNAVVKKYHNFLRKGALKACEPDMHFRLGHYFLRELELLSAHAADLDNETTLEQKEVLSLNITVVKEILTALADNVIDRDTQKLIKTALAQYESQTDAKNGRLSPEITEKLQALKKAQPSASPVQVPTMSPRTKSFVPIQSKLQTPRFNKTAFKQAPNQQVKRKLATDWIETIFAQKPSRESVVLLNMDDPELMSILLAYAHQKGERVQFSGPRPEGRELIDLKNNIKQELAALSKSKSQVRRQ